jgi:peptide-methionine (S)-S-oxide reductase
MRPGSWRVVLPAAVAVLGLAGATAAAGAEAKVATFAGGCFWCMEGPFEKLPGVKSVVSGYTGGQQKHPTYEDVSAGRTGHAEAVQIKYDPARVTYEQLLEVFWHNIDPLTANAQFCDQGSQYRSAIYYHDEAQRAAAEASRQKVAASLRGTIVTELAAAATFYPAEEYHQDYYRKNPIRYNLYRTGCGRDRRLKELWGERAGGGHK